MRAMIGGRGSRDEEPSFEVKGVVMAALFDVEQGHTFGVAKLLILSDDLTHVASFVICDLLMHL